MYFESWHDFLQMGQHGIYVWSTYFFTMLVIAYNLVSPFLAQRQVLRRIKKMQKSAAQQSARSKQSAHINGQSSYDSLSHNTVAEL